MQISVVILFGLLFFATLIVVLAGLAEVGYVLDLRRRHRARANESLTRMELHGRAFRTTSLY